MEINEFFDESNMFGSSNSNNNGSVEEDISDSLFSPVPVTATAANNARHRRPSITFAAIAPDFAAFDEYWLAYADPSSNNSPHPAVISRSNSPSAFNPARRLSLSVLFATPSPTLSLEDYNNYLASSVPNVDSFANIPQSGFNSPSYSTPELLHSQPHVLQKQTDNNTEEGLQLDLVGYANSNSSYPNISAQTYNSTTPGIPPPYYYQQPMVVQDQLHLFSPKGNATTGISYSSSPGSSSYSTPQLFLPAVTASLSPTSMGLHPLETAAYFATIKNSASPIATPIPTPATKLWSEPTQLLPSALSSPNASIQPRNHQKQIAPHPSNMGLQNVVPYPHQLPPNVVRPASTINTKLSATSGKPPQGSGNKLNGVPVGKKGAPTTLGNNSAGNGNNMKKKQQTLGGVKPKSNSMSASERKKILELRRTKTSRLKWTPELQDIFVTTIERLGVNAVPSTILDVMNVEGLTRENVASHLQKYRQHCARGTTGRSHKKFLHSQQMASSKHNSHHSSTSGSNPANSNSITTATVKPPLSSASSPPKDSSGFRPFVPLSSSSPMMNTTAPSLGIVPSSTNSTQLPIVSLDAQLQPQAITGDTVPMPTSNDLVSATTIPPPSSNSMVVNAGDVLLL